MDTAYEKRISQHASATILADRDAAHAVGQDLLHDGKLTGNDAEAESLPAQVWRQLRCNANGQISQFSASPSLYATTNTSTQQQQQQQQQQQHQNQQRRTSSRQHVQRRTSSNKRTGRQMDSSRRTSHAAIKSHSRPTANSTHFYEGREDRDRVVKTSEIALFMRCKTRYMPPDFKPIPPSPGGWDEVTPEYVVAWDKTADKFAEHCPFLQPHQKVDATGKPLWKNVSWLHEFEDSDVNSSSSSSSAVSITEDSLTPNDKVSPINDKMFGNTLGHETAPTVHEKFVPHKPPPIFTNIQYTDKALPSSQLPPAHSPHLHHYRLQSDPATYGFSPDGPWHHPDRALLQQLRSPTSSQPSEPFIPQCPARRSTDGTRSPFDVKTPSDDTPRSFFALPLYTSPAPKEMQYADTFAMSPQQPPPSAQSARYSAAFSPWASSSSLSPREPWERHQERHTTSHDGSYRVRSTSLNLSQHRPSHWGPLDLMANPWPPGLSEDERLSQRSSRPTSMSSSSDHVWSPVTPNAPSLSTHGEWVGIEDRFMSILKVVDDDPRDNTSGPTKYGRSSSISADQSRNRKDHFNSNDYFSHYSHLDALPPTHPHHILPHTKQSNRRGCCSCGLTSHSIYSHCPSVRQGYRGDGDEHRHHHHHHHAMPSQRHPLPENEYAIF